MIKCSMCDSQSVVGMIKTKEIYFFCCEKHLKEVEDIVKRADKIFG